MLVTRSQFTELVAGLEVGNPFTGPEALERQSERRFRARVGANESAFGISPRARAAATAALDRLAWYGDPENYELRADVAAHLGVDVSQVLVGAGIDDLLALLMRAFATDGGRAVMTLGSYATFAYHAATCGVALDTESYGAAGQVNLEALATRARISEYVRNHGLRRDPRFGTVVVYLANPDNPAGTWHGAAAVRDFVAELPPGCILALDEAYAEFAPPGPVPPLVTDDARVVHLRTFSKAHGMAGARVAYAVGAPEVCAGLNKLRLQFGVNRVAQEAARASLADVDFVAGVGDRAAAGREAYYELGRALGVPTLRSAANFVCFDLGTRQRAEAVLAALLARGVFVRKPAEPPLDSCIRLTVGTEEEGRIVAAELRQALDELPA